VEKVMEGYVILDPKNKTDDDRDLSVLYNALALSEFNRVKGLEKANEIWEKLMEIYEGTSTVKEAKLYVYKGKFNEFTTKKDEDISTMFNRLNDIVNELKCLDFDVTNKDFSHKFLRCLLEKYETIVTLLVRSDLNKMTPTELLGQVLTHDLFKQSQKEVQGQSTNEKRRRTLLSRPRSLKKRKMVRTKRLAPMKNWLLL
jgi:urate oxidase